MAKVNPLSEESGLAEIKIRVKRTFYPLTVSLQICGLFVPKDRKGISKWLQWMYCFISITVFWANTGRVGIVFRSTQGLSENLTTTLSGFLMYFCMSYTTTMTLIAASRRFDHLLDILTRYHSKHGFAYSTTKIRKVLTCICITVPISSCISAAGISYIWNIPGSELKRYLYPFHTLSEPGALTGMIVLGVITVYTSSGMYIALVLFGALCYCLTKEFQEFNNRVKASLDSSDNYEHLRLHHAGICRVLTETNPIVTHSLFPLLACTLPITCLMLYGVIAGSLPTEDLLLLLCMVLSLISISFGIIIQAALLNIKAHGSLDDLMCLNLEDLPTTTIQTIAVLSTRLTGPPIGFHVYGLFTIDTSTILTIAGTLLTYAVVVLQFKPDDNQHFAAVIANLTSAA